MAGPKIEVACEACGEKEVPLEIESVNELFGKMDLFICPRCAASWTQITQHFEQLEQQATAQDQLDVLTTIKKAFMIYGRDYLLKERPLPKPHQSIEIQDRLDTIIFDKEEA